PGESAEDARVRALAVSALGGLARDREVLASAQALVGKQALDPSLVDAVVGITARFGDAKLYEQFLGRARKAATPEERARYLGALGSFEDPALVRRTLDLALGGDVRVQEMPWLLAGELENRAGSAEAWRFLGAHWEAIAKRA